MPTLRIAVGGLLITAALLAASTTLASDVSSDRRQLSPQDRTRVADRRGQASTLEREPMKSANDRLCACATTMAKDHAGHQQ